MGLLFAHTKLFHGVKEELDSLYKELFRKGLLDEELLDKFAEAERAIFELSRKINEIGELLRKKGLRDYAV